jgi:hypothetical protein
MRKRLVLNEDFYKHYPHRISIEQTVKEKILLKNLFF